MKLRNLLPVALLAFCACQGKPSGDHISADTVSSVPPGVQPATAADSAPSQELPRWLVGNWEIQTPEGALTETWKVDDDSTLSAVVGLRKQQAGGKATTNVQERIQLRRRGGDFYYVPTVQGQNGGKPVEFKLELLTGDRFVAVNPAHDFPKRIRYRMRGDTALAATLEGDSASQTQSFEMVRVPEFR